MSSQKILLGVLAGVAAGAVLGILFAPDKGSVTRKKIIEKSDEYSSNLANQINEIINGLAGKIKETKEEAENLAEKGMSKSEDAVRKFSL